MAKGKNVAANTVIIPQNLMACKAAEEGCRERREIRSAKGEQGASVSQKKLPACHRAVLWAYGCLAVAQRVGILADDGLLLLAA
jgi:hypothetical protein